MMNHSSSFPADLTLQVYCGSYSFDARSLNLAILRAELAGFSNMATSLRKLLAASR